MGSAIPKPIHFNEDDEICLKTHPDIVFEHNEIHRNNWLLDHVVWDSCHLAGRKNYFIWLHLSFDALLERFPPKEIIPLSSLNSFAGNYVVNAEYRSAFALSAKRRGRPSLPWNDFHVEVARMYRDGEMAVKKEAAIRDLQDWFYARHKLKVGRSTVGERLKPYFDELGRKKTENPEQ
ncbi:MAG: hypothetical protein JKY49_18795 [Cohaesibacteraceae bacterium]|nr:hypothetical protein [Cohaesibacteraceae bacterium]